MFLVTILKQKTISAANEQNIMKLISYLTEVTSMLIVINIVD